MKTTDDKRILAAIQPDPEPQPVDMPSALRYVPTVTTGGAATPSSAGMVSVSHLDDGVLSLDIDGKGAVDVYPDGRVAWVFGDEKGVNRPSSAGMVSVEAAAKVIVDAWDADTLPVNEPDPMLPAFIAALRALAGDKP